MNGTAGILKCVSGSLRYKFSHPSPRNIALSPSDFSLFDLDSNLFTFHTRGEDRVIREGDSSSRNLATHFEIICESIHTPIARASVERRGRILGKSNSLKELQELLKVSASHPKSL